MSLVFTILFALAVLVGLVATFLTIKNWHWAQMLLMLGILLTSVGVLFLSAEVLRIHKLLRTNLPKLQAQVDDMEARNRALATGARGDATVINNVLNDLRDPEGIASRMGNDDVQQREAEALRALAGNKPAMDMVGAMVDKLAERGDLPGVQVWVSQNDVLARERGRVWRGAGPAGPVDPTGKLNAVIPVPRPHGVEKDSVVYVFEMGPPNAANPAQGAQYLGEFRVTAATDDGATLVPVLPPDQRALKRLAASKGPWSIYETMPADRHSLFAGMTSEQLQRALPAASAEEYIRHGGKVTPADDEFHRQNFNEQGLPIGPESDEPVNEVRYDRPLRAYEVLFNRLAEQRVGILAQLDAKKDELAKLAETEAKAQKLKAERTEEKRKLDADMKFMDRDLATIRKLHDAVTKQLAAAKQSLADGLAANAQLAAELARRQFAFLGVATP